ncbi:hypothetical protein C8F01DRAFT_1045948, partial [Mycena amicta]
MLGVSWPRLAIPASWRRPLEQFGPVLVRPAVPFYNLSMPCQSQQHWALVSRRLSLPSPTAMPASVWCSCTECSKLPEKRRPVSRQTRSQHERADQRRMFASPPRESDIEEDSEIPAPEIAADNLDAAVSPVIRLVLILVLWLHLRVGLSRETVNTVLRALRFILDTLLRSILLVVHAAGINVTMPTPTIPIDIRTLYTDDLEPTINRTVCCPTCYNMYPADKPIPEKCMWRKNPKRGKFCNTDLWKSRKTRNGAKRVPKRYFSVQDLGSWLSHFLDRAVIREALQKSAT